MGGCTPLRRLFPVGTFRGCSLISQLEAKSKTMNTSPLEPPSWSRQRWLLAVALVFAAQVVMIVLLAERPRRAVPAPQFGATINLALDAKSAQKLAELP